MSTLNNVFAVLMALSLLISGCAALPAQAGQDRQGLPQESAYESILGKPLFDEIVADFIASNNCASANQFLLCKKEEAMVVINQILLMGPSNAEQYRQLLMQLQSG